MPQNFFQFLCLATEQIQHPNVFPLVLVSFCLGERSCVFSEDLLQGSKKKVLSVKLIFTQSFCMTLHVMSQSMVLQMKSTALGDF